MIRPQFERSRCTRQFAFLLLMPGAAAVAQVALPTDADLRSAYCISVTQDYIGTLGQGLRQAEGAENAAPTEDARKAIELNVSNVKSDIAKTQDTLKRLQLYLLPRMTALDPIAIAAAQERGKEDSAAIHAMLDRCPNQCTSLLGQDDKWRACMESCTDRYLTERWQACFKPTWLPF